MAVRCNWPRSFKDFTPEDRARYNAYILNWAHTHKRQWKRIQQGVRGRARALGLCLECGQPTMPDVRDMCFRHWLYALFRQHTLRPRRGWTERSRKVREIVAIRLQARYDEVLEGREPISLDAAQLAAFELRKSLGIGWGEAAGVQKMARIIRAVERKAAKTR